MISLKKGEGVSLAKDRASLRQIAFGLGWDARKSGGFFGKFASAGEIDLDASCLLYDAGGRLVDQIWFRQLGSRCGSVRHSGDNRTGHGDGDDETITVDISRLPANVETAILTVNSFTGESFDKVENAYVRAVDASNGQELARYSLSDSGSHTGMIMGKLSRAGGAWHFTAVGERASGRTFHDMEGQIARLL